MDNTKNNIPLLSSVHAEVGDKSPAPSDAH